MNIFVSRASNFRMYSAAVSAPLPLLFNSSLAPFCSLRFSLLLLHSPVLSFPSSLSIELIQLCPPPPWKYRLYTRYKACTLVAEQSGLWNQALREVLHLELRFSETIFLFSFPATSRLLSSSSFPNECLSLKNLGLLSQLPPCGVLCVLSPFSLL